MSVASVPDVDLEPSLVEVGTYATRRRRAYVDVALVISLVVILLYVIPANQILPQLTVAGRPALLLSMALFTWWVMAKLNPRLVLVGPQPLRWATLFFLVSLLLSYLAGLLRGLPSLESNRQDFAILITFEFIGLILMVADGVRNRARLETILRVFVVSAGIMAVIGILQSVLKVDVARYLAVPGLAPSDKLAGFEGRGFGGQFRVASTATHYIEFSTVMAMAVPFAIHLARFGPTTAARRFYGFVAVLIAAAVPIAISRTGIVALAAAMIVMLYAWDWRTRYNMLVLACALVGGLMAVRPGLVGTIRSMFVGVENDPSIQGRTNDYDSVAAWFAQRPWLGRGPGTLIPGYAIVLDNQWLLSLVTLGPVGVAAMATLHITAIALAGLARRRSAHAEDRHLCAALISTQIVGILVAATFDALAFTTYSFTLALMTGMAGLCGASPIQRASCGRPRPGGG